MSQEMHPIERLTAEDRIVGASRVIPDGTEARDVTLAQRNAVMDSIRAYRNRTGVKWNAMARSAGIHGAVLSAINVGREVPRWQEAVIDLDRWLEEELKREASPKGNEFVSTRVAEEVSTVANAASTLKCIGLVYGWSGMGKTMALLAVAAEKPGAVFVSMETAARSPRGVLRAIAGAMGIRRELDCPQAALLARIKQLLQGTSRLVIIDEIHKLTGHRDDDALHVLRDLHDATGVPMLWSGTIDLVAYLERRQAVGKEPLSQIRRRIGIARNLTDRAGGGGGDGGEGEPLYSVDEIRNVFSRGKMRLTPEAIRYLWMLANLPDSGALGTCRNLVVMATKVNESSADTLTADMLRSVHRLLVSTRDFVLLQDRMKEPAARSTARVG